MRFQFCGNTSCPEWFIAEISVLTKITSVKMKLIFTQLVNNYLEGVDISAKALKLLGGTGLDPYEMNAVIATLNFILQNAVMYQIDDQKLNKQLVDLGLPKENVESIVKTYKSTKDKLFPKSHQKGFKDYSVHELIGSSNLVGKHSIRFAECEVKYRDKDDDKKEVSLTVCQGQLDDLIYQLEQGLTIMRKWQGKN